MSKLVLASIVLLASIYLFVQAPPPLTEQTTAQGATIEVEVLFRTVDAINAGARALYTKRIVGGGKSAGLAFGEDWDEAGVEKGPLPALFLRLVAAELERRPERLGLFLASDAPINPSNMLTGQQLQQFTSLKADGEPKFFGIDGYGEVAMFADIASVEPCVTCHNEHKDTPKDDWRLHDVMGATTWSYPTATLAQSEYIEVVEATFAAIADAYQTYLDHSAGFAAPPAIGAAWPAEGSRVLPDRATFLKEVRAVTAPAVIEHVLKTAESKG